MKGLKLKPAQYKELQGLSLQEKLAQLKSWFEGDEIEEAQLRYFSNRMIKKEHNKKEQQGTSIKRRYKTVFENDTQKLIDRLQHNIKNYVAYRNKEAVQLKTEELKKIEGMLSTCRLLPVLDDFLIIALRYPDKHLNSLAVKYVEKYRIDSLPFWVKLWSDENLVPMDAIRLMREDGKIKECFSRKALSHLLPLIEAQRNKEIQRLEWAEAVGFAVTAARRTRRLKAFNDLIAAIEK